MNSANTDRECPDGFDPSAHTAGHGPDAAGESAATADAGEVAAALGLLAGLQSGRTVGFILSMTLAVAVPMRIFAMLDRGGIDERDLARIKGYEPDLCEHGADLFSPSEEPGGTCERFNQVADLVAVLSFRLPGGVPAFGHRWDVEDYRPAWERSRGRLLLVGPGVVPAGPAEEQAHAGGD